MIIYIDANGKVLKQEYTEVVQGDNDANSIYLIAPLAQNAVVTMSFECPNGYVTDTYLMTPSIDNMVGGLRMWKLSIENIPITQYYGIVKYQFKATINGKTIAVSRGQFKVQEGVDWQLPSTPDVNVYADILNALNQVEAGFINKVNINYNNDGVEQEIINNENGLKLVKTEGGTTAVYEFKADGLYQNGVKLVDANKLEALKAEIEAELALLQVDLANLTGQIATVNSDLIEFKETAENKFELIDNTKGTKIIASVNNQNYVLTFDLQNSKGETISTSQIDLPLESVVIDGSYADGVLTLTLKNGNKINIEINDIVGDFATQEYVDYKISELNNKIDNLPTGGVTEEYVNEAVRNKLETKQIDLYISSEDWYEENNEPFKYKGTAPTNLMIDGNDYEELNCIFELVNNQPSVFAKYGIALNDVFIDEDVATLTHTIFNFVAVEQPEEDLTLTILVTANYVGILENEETYPEGGDITNSLRGTNYDN